MMKSNNKKKAWPYTEKSNIMNNTDRFGTWYSYSPSTYSLHNNLHYYQIDETGDDKYFAKFDYGEEENLKK